MGFTCCFFSCPLFSPIPLIEGGLVEYQLFIGQVDFIQGPVKTFYRNIEPELTLIAFSETW